MLWLLGGVGASIPMSSLVDRKWKRQVCNKIDLFKYAVWQLRGPFQVDHSPGLIFQIKWVHVAVLSIGAKTEDAVPWAEGGPDAVGVTVAARRHRDRGEMGPASRLGIKFDIEMDQLWTGRDEFSWGLFIKWRPSICKWENKFISSASHVECTFNSVPCVCEPVVSVCIGNTRVWHSIVCSSLRPPNGVHCRWVLCYQEVSHDTNWIVCFLRPFPILENFHLL